MSVSEPAIFATEHTSSSEEPNRSLEHTEDAGSWWRQAVVYQIYPRSFADADGNGIGDLAGITTRVPYLQELGVDAVWLSPFYPSALADGGYDVDDYRNVDPKIGTLADFDDMITALHQAGIKVLVDIVPNHTSNRHPWFREALQSPPGSPARNRYHFRDGTGPGGNLPPSDWDSLFGGPAWEPVPPAGGEPGQWYLHIFAPEQPDLNWANPEVRADFLTTLRFWSDRGVDGFRVDAAPGLVKDAAKQLPSLSGSFSGHLVPDGSHPYWDRDEVIDIYREWRTVLNSYDPPKIAVAEAGVHPDRRHRYANPDSLGQAFNFDLLDASWHPEQFRTIITDNLAEASRTGAPPSWVLSNHDVVRHATRYGLPQPPPGQKGDLQPWLLSHGTDPLPNQRVGLDRARAAVLLMLALPGSAYLYQGEELGLHEVADLPVHVLQDPVHKRSGGAEKGRDGARVPLPWTSSGPSLGFGGQPPHLPQPSWFADQSVEVQDDDPSSTLRLYRQALRQRRQLQGAETLGWLSPAGADTIHFQRPGGWQSLTNFGTVPVALPAGAVSLTSKPLDQGLLPPDATAWII